MAVRRRNLNALTLRGLFFAFLYLLFLPLVTNCGFTKGNANAVTCTGENSGTGGVSSATVAANLPAFQSTLYAAVRSAPLNCVHCHNQSGTAGQQYFAQDNAGAALTTAASLVDWNSLSDSMLVQYAGNNHCGSTECAGNGAAMLSALQAWASAANTSSCSPAGLAGGQTTTGLLALPSQPYPTNLPVHGVPANTDTFMTMQYPLDALGPQFSGAIFAIQAQIYIAKTATTPAAYRFKQPKFVSATPIHIQEVHLLVNGQEPANFTDFLSIDAYVFEPTGPMISPLISGPVVQQNLTGTDQISFGFRLIQAAANPGCKNLAGFTTSVYGDANTANTMMKNCATCHNNATNVAFKNFPMTGAPALVCAEALERSLKNDPNNSALIIKPFRAWDGHPAVKGLDLSAWITWIQSEQ